MLLTDTDTLIYKIEVIMFVKTSAKIRSYLSSLIIKKIQNSDANNSVVSEMKDKTCGVPIKHFVGLKSYIYSFMTEGNNESKKAKGFHKNVIYDELKYKYHKNGLLNLSYMRHEINVIQGKYDNVGSYEISKIFVFLR